ncbi:DivIVA domain-containing protein [Candidatus Parcubacteria bacterium]|nr:DivIVA domain-containing protein [Candidatus Parcubacteria bacterium]
MTKKILELTEKIYYEGVVKAKKEAELILSNAKKEADNIIDAAKNKEKGIAEQAQKQANELKKNTDSEMRLAARQFISNLKQQISRLITAVQVESPVREAFNDKRFVESIILTIIKNWNPQKPEELNISLLLPQNEEKELIDFFNSKAKEFLDSGLEIDFDPNIKSGFKIGPKDGSYYISFTDKDFENYFKNYLKDRTRKMIFS